MRRVAIAGHMCVDLIPELSASPRTEPGALVTVGPMRIAIGGCVGNTSRALADLGHPVSAYATVGDDGLGRLLSSGLESPLLEVRAREAPGATSYSVVLQPPGVDRTFWHHVGANASVDGSALDVEGLDLLHLGYPSLLPALLVDGGEPLTRLLRRARDAGATTSLDLAVVDETSPEAALDWTGLLQVIAAETDILTPSLDDLASVLDLEDAEDDVSAADRAAELLISWGAAVVAISAGPHGLVLRTGDTGRLAEAGRALSPLAASWSDLAMYAPALPVAHVETTNGAGDASTAAILYGLSRGWGAPETLRLAAATAATVIGGRRPTPGAVSTVDRALAPRVRPRSAAPLLLAANQPRGRFYMGGDRIALFRGMASAEPYTPEDWVASTVCVRGEDGTGLSALPDGRLLRDAIARDPVEWLGAAHLRRYGTDPKVLVKLLDAGQRLPVHAHPDGLFAAEHLGASHGKAEAWLILTPGVIHLGLTHDVRRTELAALVERQDADTLLSLLHRVPVAPGDRVFVPPGTLHAIGEGVMLVEVQEPEDLSILLEWHGFGIDGAADGHLGLGFETALGAVDAGALTEERLSELVLRGSTPAGLPAEAAEYFRLDLFEVDGALEIDGGFAVLIGLDGRLRLDSADLEIAAGATVVVPASLAPVVLRGRGRVILARPPLP